MAVPKQAKPKEDLVKGFVKGANHDAPKARSEPKESDMRLLAVRIHPDIAYSIEQHQEAERRIRSELLREIIMAGLKVKGIPILERPKAEQE